MLVNYGDYLIIHTEKSYTKKDVNVKETKNETPHKFLFHDTYSNRNRVL